MSYFTLDESIYLPGFINPKTPQLVSSANPSDQEDEKIQETVLEEHYGEEGAK